MDSYSLIGIGMLVAILLLGIGMVSAVRWSRKVNVKLKSTHKDSQEQSLIALRNALKTPLNWQELKNATINYCSSSISKPEAFLGKVLAIGIILFIIFLALLMGYLVWIRT